LTIDIKIIRKRVVAIGKNKSILPDCTSGEILKVGGKDIIPYLARLLDITMKNGILPADWEKAIMILIYKGAIDH